MSSVVCQGLQSCLVEPLVLRHKLTPPKSQPLPCPQKHNLEENSDHNDTINIDKEQEEDNIVDDHADKKKKVNKNGWSFLDSLESNPTPMCKDVSHEKTEQVYVHPMSKLSASALSSKSLEMCTESLGCETGSDISESSDEFCSITWEKERLLAMQRSRARKFISKKVVTSSFPPLLTSISGSDGVRVSPHREGGRLVIKAVNVSSCSPYFQAERTNGRLKLSLLKDHSINCPNGMPAETKEIVANYHQEDQEEEENDIDSDNENEDEYAEELYDDDEEEEEQEEEEYLVGEMEGKVGKVRGGMEMGKFSRASCCKGDGNGNGNKRISSNWESFWVAIA